METQTTTSTKTVIICVSYIGYVYQDVKVPADMEINDATMDTILKQFDASKATDINDSIEYSKLRHANTIEILDEEYESIMQVNNTHKSL